MIFYWAGQLKAGPPNSLSRSAGMENFTRLNKIIPSLSSFRNMQPLAKRELRNGLVFLLPWILGFLAFVLFPMIATFFFTFTDMTIESGMTHLPKLVGLANYANLLKDGQVWRTQTPRGSLWITLYFGAIAMPVGILLPLGIALLMNSKFLLGRNFFRSMFYMPYIIPFVASVFLWGGVLNAENGWINNILQSLGVPKANLPGWVNDVNWVYPAYVIIGIWGIGNTMLTMLAGMQAVPTDLYDAAKVDGAGGWATFWNVTFPMISPIVFYNLILSIVGLFQYFLVPLVLNAGTGNPGGATMFFNLYLYRVFFGQHNVHYGSTLAWTLFMFILIITIVLFSTARYWVYYASENP
jgi:ABC-type sugar transport system permease subunit